MNVLLIFLSVFIASGSVFAKEIILTGEIAEAGRLLKTKDKLYTFKQSELSQEISELSGKKIRALCEIENATCKLLRYEIAPFTDETGLAPWTLKQIPKYVSKKISSFNPKVTPDGNLLFWTALIERGRSSTQKIWFSSTDENGFWKAGQQMAEPLNNQAPSAVISALPGGNELFVFGSYSEDEMIRDLETEMNKENHRLAATSKSEREYKLRYADLQKLFQRRLDKIYNRVPLYKTSRTGTNWLQPNPIKFPDFYNLYKKPENPTQQVFGGSALSANGRVLIYSAMHNNTAGKLDLYVSIADKSGIFPVGRSIGRMVNTQEEEMAPFLASDDRTLYFSSTGFNGLSIYFTQRIGDGWDNWTSPIEISQNLHGVNFFTIPASGNWAYISRNGNLMMTYIPLEFRPKPVVLVKGHVLNEKGEPLSAEIFYDSLKTLEKKGNTVSDPVTGSFSIIVPFGERYAFHGKKEGYLPVHMNLDLRVADNVYKEVNVEIKLPELRKGKEIAINNLFFETNKHDITRESEPELDSLANVLKENKNIRVLIEGHTDNVGKDSDNLTLSLARAKAVSEYLIVRHKVEKDRLETKGFGKTRPLVDNNSDDNRHKNRRVMFQILE